jgi:hypothetical protein
VSASNKTGPYHITFSILQTADLKYYMNSKDFNIYNIFKILVWNMWNRYGKNNNNPLVRIETTV